MFKLSKEPIDPQALKANFLDAHAGAFVVFEGWVRDHHEDKKVAALDYESYEDLAYKEAEKILSETRKQFAVINFLCVHRVGKLSVGDTAVWVGVTAVHREQAFAACRYLIDEIKKRVPIWKKEYYENGTSNWVNCEGCSPSAHGHLKENHSDVERASLK